ncbi:MAG: LPS export ABC transporter periplasmic protein LptC [Treponema sp. RIFOXYC1_FULL_61_9]|nr:MAG: LPS export ABC transporter periplasmic protein LptC [Treponema sp. GWA1_62_8]OHE67278.1 MAG: LPS export ABC transporter periplasmic protein LptC [Treponema sp. GWC1_61_84]OHE75823.1 MAG: LPS export ABC transporter periplasmic protein LptC [Treponema sp. RIFOXYC1_FULL_61_9]
MNNRSAANTVLPILACLSMTIAACSFDYGPGEGEDDPSEPDLAMTGVEYVRVRDGSPVVRIQAEAVERFELKQSMSVHQFRFAQYPGEGPETGAVGAASSAVVDLESGDVELSGSVRIFVEDEDLSIETDSLSWKDGSRMLLGGDSVPVLIKRKDGSVFSGTGFGADARRRTWEFAGGASGTYISDDDEDEPGTVP